VNPVTEFDLNPRHATYDGASSYDECHFLQKIPIIRVSLAENDVQLKASESHRHPVGLYPKK